MVVGKGKRCRRLSTLNNGTFGNACPRDGRASVRDIKNVCVFIVKCSWTGWGREEGVSAVLTLGGGAVGMHVSG